MHSFRGVLVAAALAVPMLLSSCGQGEGPTASWREGQVSPSANALPPSLSITPAPKTPNMPISTEIGIRARGGTTAVTMVDSKQAPVAGALTADGTSWVPDRPLRYSTTYAATAVTTSPSGDKVTQTTQFTTMAEPGGTRVGTGLYLFDNIEYGVGMPVVVEFESDILESARAQIEKRMFVTTDPPQPGAWAWFGSRQAMYRAPNFWQPGTKLTVRIALDGHPMGNGRYGDMDRRATAKIGRKFVMNVDNATKKMDVFENDKLVKTMPVSLGKPATPSSSGTMVIMDRQETTVFDTSSDPDPENRYVVDIQFAQRLTWGGEFIHSAPWSVGDQGVRNVSHGCVNVSEANASWLFSRTKVGDPVTVKGTERRLEPGNGWTAWDLSWPEFLKLSALPHPEFAGAAAGQENHSTEVAPTPSPTR